MKSYIEKAVWKNGVRISRKHEHIALAEAALGGPLPCGAQVHHFNGDNRDNSPGNLVICQDRAYHALLHRRQEAKAASGNPNYRKCCYCKQWSDPSTMGQQGKRPQWHHRDCRRSYERSYNKQRGEVA